MRHRTDRPGRDGREPGPEHRKPGVLASRSSTAPPARSTTSWPAGPRARTSSAATRSKNWSRAWPAPRKVMLMVKAGPAVDEFIEQLIPLLSPGDVIIDGGNTHFSDTERRTELRRVEGPALHRHRRLRRRRGRAEGPQHDARRQRRRPGRWSSRSSRPSPPRSARTATSPAANGSARAAPATTSRWSTTASSTATCS